MKGTVVKSDVELIWDVLTHFCYLVDTRRYSEVPEAIFTENASDDHGFGEVSGRDSLREMFLGAATAVESTVHSLSNHSAMVDGDKARSRCYVTAWHWSRATESQGPLRPADFVTTGAYVDELERMDGQWFISRRKCHMLGPGGLAVGSVPAEFDAMMHNVIAAGPPADVMSG